MVRLWRFNMIKVFETLYAMMISYGTTYMLIQVVYALAMGKI